MRPDSTSHCNTRQPCLTLSEYVQNTSHYFTSNSVLHFLSGNHTISQTIRVIVQDVHNISLVGSAGHATVQCNGRLSFTFWEVHGLQISKIGFLQCGLEVTGKFQYADERTEAASEYHIQVALLFVECSSVMLESVTVMESYGYGLLGYNMMMAELNHCLFHHNYWRRRVDSNIKHSSPTEKNLPKVGGNAVFNYGRKAVSSMFKRSTLLFDSFAKYLYYRRFHLTILHTEFAHGRNRHESPYLESALVHGGGLGIRINSGYSALVEAVNITVYNCIIYENTALVGANMFLSFHMPLYSFITVHIKNCKFFGGRSTLKGGGLMMQIARHYEAADDNSGSVTVYLADSELYSNSAANGGGIYFGVEGVDISDGPSIIIIDRCICHDNNGRYGSAMYVYMNAEATPTFISLQLCHSKFIQNAAHMGGNAVYIGAPVDSASFQVAIVSTTFFRNYMLIANKLRNCAVLYLSCIKNITILNSTFSDNNCTSVAAGSSKFHFQGTVGFYRNTGYSGGALAFHHDADCESNPRVTIETSMILNPHTSVYIVNNTAVRYGGGILAEDECTMGRYCFFQTLSYTQMTARVVMEGNRAGKAGDSIFGGCLNSCYMTTPSTSWVKITPKIFSSLFQIRRETQSEVAARPCKICFCDRDVGDWLDESVGYDYRCLSAARISHFRGETFHVPAMIVGDYGYASPALVRTVIGPGDSGELEGQQSTQDLGNMCANLTYSVRTPQESIKLYLSVESRTDDMALAILNIPFRPCPHGFNLSGNPPKCDCALQLRKRGVKCNISTQLIHRPALVWIGNYSDEVVVHTNCPFDYCKPKDNEISLYEQDQQCAFNRSGVLCGACQPGLSLALGTSQCMQCSNIYILLFIPFALAGVVLIILMLKCNLTVSTGTLNGLIFYANIIRANHAVFFPLGRSEGFSSLLSVFIAWLNLDLGVEVCLFHGMDTYIRTWLQFVFPIYIWILIGLMICSSRYSTTIARLSGSNTVSVLATLFLLSYAKLLRTIISAISFTTLTDRHGNTAAVWLLDGNMPAMKGSHIPLVLMSIAALVVYVIPFTMLVLLTPWLQARSNYRLLRWVNKIKPLLDAYQGPYRDKFRYWTGLLLLVRIVLFTIFGGNALGDPRINLFAITTVVATLLVFWVIAGKVYKKLWMKLLESFFLLNLIILAAATLFLKSLEGFSVVRKQAVLTSIMVGSAALVFIGILAYHCCQEVTKKSIFKNILAKCIAFVTDADHDRGCAENSEGVSDGSTAAVPQQPTVSVIAMNELREPLLTDS